MPDLVSLTSVAAVAANHVARNSAKKLSETLAKNLTDLAVNARDQLAMALHQGFEHYLSSSYEKCCIFKTIINPHEPLNVIKYYIHITFSLSQGSASDDQLIEDINKYKYIVVSGLAGSGKSMFMKYLTLRYFETTREITPLFFELRQLNSLTNKDLLSTMRNLCVSKTHTISEGQFALALKAGAFLLILDGFDELNHDIRSLIQEQIFKIKRDYPATSIIISSRPDDARFGSWAAFYICNVDDFPKDKIIELIQILPYDSGVKSRFIKAVGGTLYQTHESFLKSPLLASIMLLTFEAFAHLPAKVHTFYAQAFATLFLKHDAQKEQYQRKLYSGLDFEDFKDCFATFCAISYMQEKFSFTDENLKSILEQAAKFFIATRASASSNKKLRFSATQFAKDLEESLCMLQQDGIEKSFVHRSFQEYFAAYFVTKLHSSKIKAILDKYCLRSGDTVISMLYDMHREPIEAEWVLPTIDKLLTSLPLEPGAEALAKLFRVLFDAIIMHDLDRNRHYVSFSASAEALSGSVFLSAAYFQN